jgi:alkanesulfonate monooxygenase SsuD/methylene tetrahydromethanopterin reductase-like flavin-dependent oxidoreductase (luciferase family)
VTSPIRERVADAALAEEAGWDGLFVWDQLIGYNKDLVGEFAATNILLTAAALATIRIRLAPRSRRCRGDDHAISPARSPPWTGSQAAA